MSRVGTRNLLSDRELGAMEASKMRGPRLLSTIADLARDETDRECERLDDAAEYRMADRLEASGIEAASALEIYRRELEGR